MKDDFEIYQDFSIIDFANIPITLISGDYHYRMANTCFCVAHGKQKDQIIGKSVEDVWGKETFGAAIKPKLDLCFTGQVVRHEAWMDLPTRCRRYCEVVYSPYSAAPVGVSHAVVITYDITERKEMEEALAEGEQRFRKLSEASLEAIVFTENLVVVDANSALNHLFGYEGEELMGRRATDFIAPQEQVRVEEIMRTQAESKYETTGLRKDGTTFPIEVKGRQFIADGYTLTISAIRDLTEHKRAEKQLKTYQEHLENLVKERTEKLQVSEERFRKIFLNATEGIFQITPEGRILNANPAFARIHGYDTVKELVQEVGDTATLYADPEIRGEYLRLLNTMRRVRNFECNVLRKDGTTTWVSVNARLVRDQAGQVLYHEGTVQDVNERRHMEEQLLIQRDLALSLAATLEKEDALLLCLSTAIKVCGSECGTIHIRNDKTDDLEMAAQIGLTKGLAERFSCIEAGSKLWSLSIERMQSDFSLSVTLREPARSHLLEEGINALAMVPVLCNDRVIATMNLGFFNAPAVASGWPTLELIASVLGNIMVRIETQQELKRDIEKRTKVEEALQAKSRSLEEINTALKVLLNQREMDKSELEESVLANVRQLVLPYVGKLRETRLEEIQGSLLDVVEDNLNNIVSPFLKRVRVFNFTPKELEVAALIKEGKTTKDIAAILRVGMSAIDVHRYNIRKKLGINQASTNLRSYLLSLD